MASFSVIFSWLIAHGYFIMFAMMFVEGPIVTIAAGFATAGGFFNIFLVYLISLLGDVLADALYYGLGYGFRWTIIEKISRRLGRPVGEATTMARLLEKHPFKTILSIKLAPFLPMPAFMIIGYTRFAFFKYLTYCSVVSGARSLFLLLGGYFFGRLFLMYSSLRYVSIWIGVIGALLVLFYLFFRKLAQWLVKKG